MILDPTSVSAGAFYQFMISVIVPRPIAFVSTMSPEGQPNVAPFSYFNAITNQPPLLGISINRRRGEPKDTLRNLRGAGGFVVNIVNEPMLKPMVRASGDWPPDVSEFEVAGLRIVPFAQDHGFSIERELYGISKKHSPLVMVLLRQFIFHNFAYLIRSVVDGINPPPLLPGVLSGILNEQNPPSADSAG